MEKLETLIFFGQMRSPSNGQRRQRTFTFSVAGNFSISAHVSERLGGLTANLGKPFSFFGSISMMPSWFGVGTELQSVKSIHKKCINSNRQAIDY